uniref:Uncharacterized protein n=1 Tax=Rhipicephalus appendiculatus TaxID=34631 RepID=A0A131YDQ6_RHIAP
MKSSLAQASRECSFRQHQTPSEGASLKKLGHPHTRLQRIKQRRRGFACVAPSDDSIRQHATATTIQSSTPDIIIKTLEEQEVDFSLARVCTQYAKDGYAIGGFACVTPSYDKIRRPEP